LLVMFHKSFLLMSPNYNMDYGGSYQLKPNRIELIRIVSAPWIMGVLYK